MKEPPIVVQGVMGAEEEVESATVPVSKTGVIEPTTEPLQSAIVH